MVVTKDTTECDVTAFTAFADDRIPTLFSLLESATTQAAQESVVMT